MGQSILHDLKDPSVPFQNPPSTFPGPSQDPSKTFLEPFRTLPDPVLNLSSNISGPYQNNPDRFQIDEKCFLKSLNLVLEIIFSFFSNPPNLWNQSLDFFLLPFLTVQILEISTWIFCILESFVFQRKIAKISLLALLAKTNLRFPTENR